MRDAFNALALSLFPPTCVHNCTSQKDHGHKKQEAATTTKAIATVQA